VPATLPASLDAAVAAATYGVLRARVPAQEPALTARYAAYVAALPDGAEKANGLAVGAAAAEQLLAARASDGFDAAPEWVQPLPGPGVFEPVAPTPPVDPQLASVSPLLPRALERFRPPGPSPLGSRRHARDLREVKELGAVDSAARTAAQTETARFWAEHAFTQIARSVRELAVDRGMETVEASWFLAKVHLAAAEAMLAGFEAKYHFLSWRPVHAIRRADTDGNPDTAPDPAWASLLAVNHPEYPSAHAFLTSATTRAIARFLGADRVPWTISSSVTGTARAFESLRDVRDDVADARVWAGLHFRGATEDGDRLGRDVERFTQRFLRPLPSGEEVAGDEAELSRLTGSR
jgi:hypothetical protein